jgi:hypothetical protein
MEIRLHQKCLMTMEHLANNMNIMMGKLSLDFKHSTRSTWQINGNKGGRRNSGLLPAIVSNVYLWAVARYVGLTAEGDIMGQVLSGWCR